MDHAGVPGRSKSLMSFCTVGLQSGKCSGEVALLRPLYPRSFPILERAVNGDNVHGLAEIDRVHHNESSFAYEDVRVTSKPWTDSD